MDTVISGGLVIDGTGAAPEQNQTLHIQAGKILSREASNSQTNPQDTQRIDASCYTVMPGFIDCHAHLSYHEYDLEKRLTTPASLIAIRTLDNLRRVLHAGVTTVREAGGLDAGFKIAINEGLIEGPDLCLSLIVMAQTGALWDLSLTTGAKLNTEGMQDRPYHYLNGVDNLREKSRELLFAGADVLNISTTGSIHRSGGKIPQAMFTPEEIETVVAEAKNAGKYVMAHVDGGPGVANAINAGVRSVDHPYYLSDADIELLLKKDTFLVPTLACNYGILKTAERYPDAGVHSNAIVAAKRIIEIHEEGFSRAAAAGVKMAMGSDSFGWFQADNLLELELMVKSGYTPLQAICAGTWHAAECLGIYDRTGSLEVGKDADMIVVEGNPLDDIGVLTNPDNIKLVLKKGIIYKNTLINPEH